MGRAARWLRGLLGGRKDKENSNSGDRRKEKKRWSFDKSGREWNGAGNVGQIPAAAEEAWMGSCYSETEKEQSKHAIAVAAATAAAADAAVAAAQAAIAVVRLTSQGRGTMFGGGGGERWAAVKIQTTFRGYLARKALRALKGLVKLQAHVRGYLVRRRAAETLQTMQALIRAQATLRMQKGRLLKEDRRLQPDIRPCYSIERFDDTRSEHTASIHSRRLSASVETALNTFDESPKTVEIDTYRANSRSGRANPSPSDCGEECSLFQTRSSLLPCEISLTHLSTTDSRNFGDFDSVLTGEDCRFTTAQSTPRFINSGGMASGTPSTPAKSVCGESFFRQYSNYPSYMANTQSFRAKVRSHSAPKQRPSAQRPKRGLSLNDMVESRDRLSGVQMRRSCSQVQEAFNFKNAVMSRLDRSAEFVRGSERDCLHRRW